MKDYIPIIVSIIAGFFAIVSAMFSWKLKLSSDKTIRELSQKDKSYDTLKTLYIKIHEMFEEAIKATKEYKTNDLNSQFSKLTAEVQMMASDEVIEKYISVAYLHNDWAILYVKAYPEAINGYKIMYSKSSNPTLKYKQQENEVYDKFYNEYEKLIKAMRFELTNNI